MNDKQHLTDREQRAAAKHEAQLEKIRARGKDRAARKNSKDYRTLVRAESDLRSLQLIGDLSAEERGEITAAINVVVRVKARQLAANDKTPKLPFAEKAEAK